MIFTILVLFMVAFVALQNDDTKAKATTISNSTSYTLGKTQSGTLTENGSEKQYYKFTVQSLRKIQITGSAYMQYVYLYLYDENANELWRDFSNWNSTSEVITIN